MEPDKITTDEIKIIVIVSYEKQQTSYDKPDNIQVPLVFEQYKEWISSVKLL